MITTLVLAIATLALASSAQAGVSDPCFDSPCRLGQCYLGSLGEAKCLCFPGVTGELCDQRIRCSTLSAPANGAVRSRWPYVNGRAAFSCNTGYALYGNHILTCTTTGQWSDAAPYCRRKVTCSTPPGIENGIVQGTGSGVSSANPNGAGHLGLRAQYRCNGGYRLVGQSYRTCQQNGQWSGESPRCEPIAVQCGPAPGIENGGHRGTGPGVSSENPDGANQLGVTIQYSCLPGYRLFGSQQRTCQQNGQWSGQPARCVPAIVQCGPAPGIENGGHRGTGSGVSSENPDGANQLGVTIRYSCLPGYRLIGSQQRTCQQNGQWSGQPAQCVPTIVQCGPAPGIENGGHGGTGSGVSSENPDGANQLGVTIRYSCLPGYRLTGSQQRTCQQNGQWSGQPAQCVPEETGCVDESGKRRTEGSSWMVASGFTGCQQCYCQPQLGTVRCADLALDCHFSPPCSEDFDYVPPANSCVCFTCRPKEVVQCPQFTPIANGGLTLSSRRVGATARFRCLPGFTLQGSAERTCQANGEWDGEDATCVHSTETVCVDESGERHAEGSSWTAASGFTGCQQCYCQLGAARCARIALDCHFSPPCSEDFDRVPPANSCVCFTCRPKEALQCPQFTRIANGGLTLTSRRVGATARFQCLLGFTLQGSAERTCQANGEWDGEDATCVRSTETVCVDESGERHAEGSSWMVASGFTGCQECYCQLGAVRCARIALDCAFSPPCSEDFDRVPPANSCVCFTCRPKEALQCPQFTSISNGGLGLSSRRVGATARFQCLPGFTLQGSAERTCQANGEWDGEDVTCVRNNGCQDTLGKTHAAGSSWLMANRGCHSCQCHNGQARCNQLIIDCQLLPPCQEGYETVPAADACECQSCRPRQEVRCPPFQSVQPGLGVQMNSNRVGAVARFSCARFYGLLGSEERVCQANGQWDGEETRCVPT
ncbi:sushi, von Willebrand factor type A, EGF and pentraxin domain-containing protein 1-like [Sycon ciliatum]|uniref:sushi, von Willebrand factor type A, EGF and pentraxin domain-containing protein 1-like n=1 Tax=Sycon ciliatum TaxID=27933 RepID=UPI0031F6D333